jgi:thioredoxin 2
MMATANAAYRAEPATPEGLHSGATFTDLRCGSCHRPLAWVADADDDTFAEIAEAATVPVLVDLWAPWCAPCRIVSPALERLARDLAGRIKLVKVNIDEAPRLAQRFNVRAVPTLLILRKGELAAQQAGGLLPPALRTWVEQALAPGDS